MEMTFKVSLGLKRLLVPYHIDSKASNVVLALLQIFVAVYVCFVVDPNVIGMPWNKSSSGLELFELSPLLLEEMQSYLPPVSTYPLFFALLFSWTKTLGSLLVIVGLGTRLVGLLYFIVALLYLYNYHYVSDFNYVFPIVFIVFSALLLFFGGGRYSIDYLIAKRRAWLP
jgi:uncharacterized membrane protein YphA (DoxX/SURF4 family)